MSTTSKSHGPSAFERKLETFIQAAQTLIKTGTPLTIGGKPFDGAQLVTQLQAFLALYQASDGLRAQLRQSISARNSEAPTARQFFFDAKSAVTQLFGSTAPELSQFGFVKKERAPLTGEQLVVRAAKVNATRAARGTKGARQRAAITGNTGALKVSVVPSVSAAAPAQPGQ